MTELLADFPPKMVRLLARNGKRGGPMTDGDIAKRTPARWMGSSWAAGIYRIHDSWDNVSVQDMLCFTDACGLPLSDAKAWARAKDYIRNRPSFKYLRADRDWPRYKSLLCEWCATATPQWGAMVKLQSRLSSVLKPKR